MEIRVWSVGAVTVNADSEHQEPQIREMIEQATADTIGLGIGDYIDTDVSNISHAQYAEVRDNGTVTWRGWLTGHPDAPPPPQATGGSQCT
jgi:hypothetical protein